MRGAANTARRQKYITHTSAEMIGVWDVMPPSLRPFYQTTWYYISETGVSISVEIKYFCLLSTYTHSSKLLPPRISQKGNLSIMKIETASIFEALVHLHQTTWLHIRKTATQSRPRAS
jgi:hypothetical protein